MKTQLQYPNGLSITIEHEIEVLPQLLETTDSNDESAIRIKQLEARIEELLREANERGDELWQSQNKIADLQKQIVELNKLIVPSDAIPTRHVSPSQQENFFKKKEKPTEKAAPKWSKKTCAKCGQLFQPTGPRSTLCENCKAEKQTEPAE